MTSCGQKADFESMETRETWNLEFTQLSKLLLSQGFNIFICIVQAPWRTLDYMEI